MILSVAMLLITVGLFGIVPKGFIPSEDTGQLTATTQADPDASFDAMVRHQQTVSAVIRKNPDVEAVNSNIGAGSSANGSGSAVAGNSGSLFIRLKPRSQRDRSADEILQTLRSQLAAVPGIQVFLQNPPAIPIGTQQTTGLYQLALQSSDLKPLQKYVPQLLDRMRQLPDIQDVNSDLQTTSQIKIDVDRDKASALGITAQQIESTLRSAYSAYQVSTIYGTSDQYQVILELEPQYQQDPDALMKLYISTGNNSSENFASNTITASATSTASTTSTVSATSTGQAIPLSNFATLSRHLQKLKDLSD
jgi:hydrophobic/amphiphilic exporter-1 (mainly G- bacteria), HAE1 family